MRLAAAAALLCVAGAVNAQSVSPAFCDRLKPLTAEQQDKLLRFAGIVRRELQDKVGEGAALVSRSGLDLSRFSIRYSHTGVAWRAADGAWSARQLYYACDEGRPRIFDQGMAGFAMGIDDPALGYVAIVRLPQDAAVALREAALDTPRALHLLAGRYSANAYPFSLEYQNCNQCVAELLAAAWGELADGDDLRARAQDWLRTASYAPESVQISSRWLMFGALFVPLIHLDDHPKVDVATLRMQVSLPASLEAFARARLPASERVEICHDGKQVVVHKGWLPVADGCVPGPGDRVILFD